MSKLTFWLVAALCLVSAPAAQAGQMPSKIEVNQLVDKTAEKLNGLEKSLRAIKPLLDKVDPAAFQQDMDACDAGLAAVSAIRKNGPSAYALVGLISILDDLKVDTIASLPALANEATKLDPNARLVAVADISGFIQGGNACYDMSELLLHTTLRYISVEESLLNELMDHGKK